MSALALQSPPGPAAVPVRHSSVLAVTCLALGTVVAAMASLNVALPSLASGTRASQTQLSWVIDAYSLVFASVLLVGGALGDRFGRRRALLAGLVIFALGSAIAPFTTSVHALIGLRAVLGAGAALVMPATLSTITSTFPRDKRAAAVSVWAAVAGASAVAGLLASGLLLELWSWRSVFALNVVLATLAFAGTAVLVPDSADPEAPRIDVAGAAFTVAGFGALVYSIIEAPERGWTDTRTLAGITLGLAALAGFLGWELRIQNPLLNPRLFAKPAFAAGTLSICLQFFAFFGFIFVAMQYLQLVRGDSALLAALSMLPMAAAMMPCARLVPLVVHRVGARSCCIAGLLLVTAGLVVLSRLNGASSYWLVVAGLVPLGAGMGLAMTPATSAVTDSLPPSLQGVGSAVNDLAREFGGALGIAVLSSLVSTTYRNNLTLPGLPPALAEQARSSLGVAAHLGQPVLAQAQSAFIAGMHIALLGGAAATAVAAVAVTVLLRPARRPARRPDRHPAQITRPLEGERR